MKYFLIILVSLISSILSSCFLSSDFNSLLYSVGILAKDFLITILPFIIFLLILTSFIKLKSNSFKSFFYLVFFSYISSLICVWFSHSISYLIINNSHSILEIKKSEVPLELLFKLKIPYIFNNYQALILSIITGFLLKKKLNKEKVEAIQEKIQKISNILIQYFVKPIVPFIICGSTTKLFSDGDVNQIFLGYGYILLLFFILAYLYIGTWHFLILKLGLKELKELIPPYLIGLSTASSAVALPLLIQAVEKNSKSPQLSRPFIPILINIHPLGNHVLFPIIINYLGCIFNDEISIGLNVDYILFSLKYSLAVFTSAGVPGGSGVVIEPVLKNTLMFSDTIFSILLSIYTLLDLVATPTNMLGNNAFVCFASKVIDKDKKNKIKK